MMLAQRWRPINMLKFLMSLFVSLLLLPPVWAERSSYPESKSHDSHSFNRAAPNKLQQFHLFGEKGLVIQSNQLPNPCQASHLNRNTIESCHADPNQSLSIDAGKKIQKSQFEGLSGALTQEFFLKSRIGSTLEDKLARIKQEQDLNSKEDDRDVGLTEVGYIRGHSKLVKTYVGSLKSAIFAKPLVNFDDNAYIYFDVVGILNPSTQRSRGTEPLQREKLQFLRGGTVWVEQPAHKMIIENLINNAGIVEANYISIHNEQVLLDHKPITNDDASEKKYYLIKVLKEIRTHVQPIGESASYIPWNLKNHRE